MKKGLWFVSLVFILNLIACSSTPVYSTVTTTNTRNAYMGNGSLKTYTYAFRIAKDTDIEVYINEVKKTLGADYTLTGVDSVSGGTVVFTNAPAIGDVVLLIRNTSPTQEVDYLPNDPFPAETHEKALDKLALTSQDAWEAIGRAIKFKKTSKKKDIAFPDPVAGRFLRWDDLGQALMLDTAPTYSAVTSAWADARDYASFSDAIDSINTAQKTLAVSTEMTVTTSKTVPANVEMLFLQGGKLSIRGDCSVTFNGGFHVGTKQVFSKYPHTTVKVQANQGDTSIDVNSTNNLSGGMRVWITLDNSTLHRTKVATVVDGDTITVDDAIPTGRNALIAGQVYTFGTVSFGKMVDSVYPQWFGAVLDGSADDSDAMLLACESGQLVMLTGMANIKSTTINIPVSCTGITGVDYVNCGIKYSGTSNAIFVGGADRHDGQTFKNFRITQTASGSTGIYVKNTYHLTVSGVYFESLAPYMKQLVIDSSRDFYGQSPYGTWWTTIANNVFRSPGNFFGVYPITLIGGFKMALSNATGTFTVGRKITGSYNGATATVQQHVGNTLYVVLLGDGIFQDDEVVTEEISGITANVNVTASYRNYGAPNATSITNNEFHGFQDGVRAYSGDSIYINNNWFEGYKGISNLICGNNTVVSGNRYENTPDKYKFICAKTEADKFPKVNAKVVAPSGVIGYVSYWQGKFNCLYLHSIDVSGVANKSVTNITRLGSTATATVTAHGWNNGDLITISGAVESGYNGTFKIAEVTTDTFSYTVNNLLDTPATGTITAKPSIFLIGEVITVQNVEGDATQDVHFTVKTVKKKVELSTLIESISRASAETYPLAGQTTEIFSPTSYLISAKAGVSGPYILNSDMNTTSASRGLCVGVVDEGNSRYTVTWKGEQRFGPGLTGLDTTHSVSRVITTDTTPTVIWARNMESTKPCLVSATVMVHEQDKSNSNGLFKADCVAKTTNIYYQTSTPTVYSYDPNLGINFDLSDASNKAVTSITRVGAVATVTTTAAHGLFNGDFVTISGATQVEYNGTYVITNVGASTFDYTVAGAPATPATGTIIVNLTDHQVTGTDGKIYTCKLSHAASTQNQPVIGQEWHDYWTLGGSVGGVWDVNKKYYRSTNNIALLVTGVVGKNMYWVSILDYLYN